MKRTLFIQALAVFMSASLVASMGEEESTQGTSCVSSLVGQKRSHNDLGKGKEEDNGAVKKTKSDATVNMATQEATSQTIVLSSPLELLPNELLVYISRFLPHKDFLSFAAMNKPTREVLFATYFQDPIPPRTWRLALNFHEGTRTGSTGLIFENVVMPRVMQDLLVMFKSQEPNRGLDFKDTLARFKDFTYKGQTLDKTPLGRFMAVIRKTNPDFLDWRELGARENFGDGDALFLNMLHYIKSRFAKNPQTLPHYRAPAQARMLSPQARLFKADGMRNEIAVLVNTSKPAITCALKIEELIKTFDFIAPSDLFPTAKIFHEASQAVADTAQKSAFLARSAQLMERYYTDVKTPDAGGIYDLACQYYNAAHTSANPNDKAAYFPKSAQWWEAYFEMNPAPANDHYRVATGSLYMGARALKGTRHHASLATKAAHFLDFYLERKPTPTVKDAWYGGLVYAEAFAAAQNEAQRQRALEKCVQQWESYLERSENPTSIELSKTAHAYLKLSSYAANLEERLAVLHKGLTLATRAVGDKEKPALFPLILLASLHGHVANAHSDIPKQKEHCLLSVSYWFEAQNIDPGIPENFTEEAALTCRHAALLSEDPQQNLAYLLKADELFKRYLLKETRPSAETVAKAQEVAALLGVLRQQVAAARAPQDTASQGH